MSAIDRILKVFDKLPKEQQQKAVPLLKRIVSIVENNNEIIKRKYEFNTQFTAVVGVVFGVLAAFNNIGENKLADIAYIVGLVCCGLCLLLCVIGLYQPVHNEQVKRDNNIIKACGDLINVFTVENEQTEGEPKETELIEEIKPSKTFKWLHICSHVLFVVAIICMVIKIIILYVIAYS